MTQFEFKKRIRAPKWTKKILQWCRRKNAKTAFFVFLTWGYILAIWGAALALFVLPKKDWLAWGNVVIGFIACCMVCYLRFCLIAGRMKRSFKKRPNQSSEPTTTAVTIPAAQEVVPAAAVAHL